MGRTGLARLKAPGLKLPGLSGLTAAAARARAGAPSKLIPGGLPLAIDFGTSALKILQVTGPESPALVAAASLEVPEELRSDPAQRLDFHLEALPRLVCATGFRGKRAACSIPAGMTVVKHLRLQRPDAMPLGSLVAGALPAQLGVDGSALVYRWFDLGEASRTPGKAEVLCIATRRDLVERLMGAIKGCRLEPVGIHDEFTAMVNACSTPEDDGHVVLYVDLGAGSTKVAIAKGRTIRFAKVIDIGGRHLDQAVGRRMESDAPTARAARLAMDDLAPASGSVPELREPLEMLTDELSMCLRYCESAFADDRVDRAVFVGGEARHVALCQHVARALKLSARVADPASRVARTGKEPVVGADLSGSQPGWAVALGTCLSRTDL